MKTAATLFALACIALLSATHANRTSAQAGAGNRDAYKLDTGDVVALHYQANDGRKCDLHVVQMDGDLRLPFGEIHARNSTVAAVRKELSKLSMNASKKGMKDVKLTIVDLRNSRNDQFLQNLH